MALGVDKHYQCKDNQIGLSHGSVLVMVSDGILETRNENGQMFGRGAVNDIIYNNAVLGADDIVDAVFRQIKTFRGAAEPEDDATLVVFKLL